jgi:hypothetical protein
MGAWLSAGDAGVGPSGMVAAGSSAPAAATAGGPALILK